MLLRLATAADIPSMRALDLASAFGARWSEAHYQGLFAGVDRQKHLVRTIEIPPVVVKDAAVRRFR